MRRPTPKPPFSALPAAQGLYDPSFESDACGVAFVADLGGVPSHRIVSLALTALRNMDHRGAAGAEPSSGDGAGVTVQVPDAFLRAVAGFELPSPGGYAVGIAFLPDDDERRAEAVDIVTAACESEGLQVLGWRELPTDPAGLGPTALAVMPRFRQLFVHAADGTAGLGLERRAFAARKVAERQARERDVEVYFPSLSARTLTYKGMLTTAQLATFFPDLSDERFASAVGLVHSRFSTNTFPSWPLAHPFRYLAHNGEINTIRGNRNWMRTREALLRSELLAADNRSDPRTDDDLSRLFPICTPGLSDSATFDEVLELLHLGGRSLPHAVLMMIPEAWENHDRMDAARRAFYQFHGTLMEPWDGPACVSFTDGTVIGAVLDRNGLRPGTLVADHRRVGRARQRDRRPGHRPARRSSRRAGCSRAGCSSSTPRAARSSTTPTSRPSSPPRTRTREWLHAGLMQLDDLPDREHVGVPARGGHPAPADLRLHRGGAAPADHPDGDGRRRAARLDGHRHPAGGALAALAAALRLLQRAVRPGHQPAAGRDPRGDGDLVVRDGGAGAEPARTRAGILSADRASRGR